MSSCSRANREEKALDGWPACGVDGCARRGCHERSRRGGLARAHRRLFFEWAELQHETGHRSLASSSGVFEADMDHTNFTRAILQLGTCAIHLLTTWPCYPMDFNHEGQHLHTVPSCRWSAQSD